MEIIIEKYFKELTSDTATAVADARRAVQGVEREDQRHLAQGHRQPVRAPRAALAGHCQGLRFKPGTEILDFGTGGGFPGIPLAILFPECQFKLIDGTGKKIRVAQEVADGHRLEELQAGAPAGRGRARTLDFVVSRAVMPLPDLVKIVNKNIQRSQCKNALGNGVICLKGGELQAELQPFKQGC